MLFSTRGAASLQEAEQSQVKYVRLRKSGTQDVRWGGLAKTLCLSMEQVKGMWYVKGKPRKNYGHYVFFYSVIHYGTDVLLKCSK